MKYFSIVFLWVAMTIISNSQPKFTPPVTKQVPIIDKIHNFEITDYYQWLEDKNNPETLEWSKAQHKYTVDYLKSNTKSPDGLREEITKLIDRDYEGAPFKVGNREFYYAKKKGDQQSKLYTIIKDKSILIFDPMQFDKNGLSAITGVSYTKDGEKAAIGMQYKGNEISTYRIIDTKNGKVIGNTIDGLSGFSWTKDEKHAYISVRTKEMIEKQQPVTTYLHTIGADRSTDKFLVAPKDAKDFASIWDARFADVTFISEGDFYSNTLKIKKTFTEDEPKVIYSSKKAKQMWKLGTTKFIFTQMIMLQIIN